MLVRSPRARTLLLVLIGAHLLLSTNRPADAQESGVDLVVAIDQSGSMWGHPDYHPAKNDKWNHRIGGTQEIVLRLLDDAKGSSRVHRFSIIDFGDEAEAIWSNQVLRRDPADPDHLEGEVRSWLERRIKTKPWINTNTPAAMELAASELRGMADSEPLAGQRRIVLIVTDGRANLPRVGRNVMRGRVREQARALDALDAEIWVVGLNDADSYWLDGDGAFWKEVAGSERRARLAEVASRSLPEIFYELVGEWLDSPCEMVAGEYVNLPYRSRLIFRVNFGKPRGTIRILDPQGFELTRTAGSPTSDPGTYAHFARRDPAPGVYKMERDSDRHYVICAEWAPPEVERLQPAGTAFLAAETRLVFQAKNGAGEPLQVLPEAPVSPSLTILPPSGTPLDLPVTIGTDGKLESTWKPGEAGTHRIELRGRVGLDDGREVDVFASASGPYQHIIEVGNEHPYWLEMVEPSATRGFHAAPWTDSAPLELALVDGDGERVSDLDGTVREPESWLTVTLIDPEGVTVEAPIPLVPTAANTFRAELPLDPERLRWQSLRQLGELNLRVEAQPGRLSGERFLNALRLPPEAEELRVGGDPMTAGPLPVYLSAWLLALAGLAALGLVAVIAIYFGTRTLPNMQIQRRDAQRGGKVELKVFDLVADPTGAGARAFSVTGKRHFKLDGQVRPLADGQQVMAERLRVTRLTMPGKARARLEYRWQGEKKAYSMLLTAGSYKSMQGLQEGTSRTVALLSEGT